jgi:predicted phosphodiesterase
MGSTIKTLTFLFIALVGSTIFYGQEDPPAFSHALENDIKPWTIKPFYNKPENFQFAIVSDRTGGHRDGVFGKGIEKINQLYPEFVMSVGDFIEGYTKNDSLINEQWDEFHGLLDPLSSRFFYVAGNHDYSNSTMATQWKERFGKDYYHFIYKDVLFLIMNTNDGDGVLISNDQLKFLKDTLAQYANVRWTMVFMHHPIWVYGDVNGFDQVEKALADRRYTVFAGHTHRYLHQVRNDQNHYVLATTGGGSKLRGPKFGEFDHFGWVTMTDDGPKLANISLSGINRHDVSNEITHEMANSLIETSKFKTLVLARQKDRKVQMVLNNSSDSTIYFKGRLYHNHHIKTDASHFQISIPARSSEQLVIHTSPIVDLDESKWDPLELEWEMGYDVAFMDPKFRLKGTEIIEMEPSNTGIVIPGERIFLKNLQLKIEHPFKELFIKYSVDGNTTWQNAAQITEPSYLSETTEVNVALYDVNGFQSAYLGKKYEKVKPSAAIKVRNPKKGLAYTYYEGNFIAVPNFAGLSPIKSGTALEFAPDKIGQRADHYAIQYSGYIKVPETGVYTFYLRSDDGSKLYLDGELVVDNDGSHSANTKEGMKALKKGMHPIRIDYFEDFLGEELQLFFSGPGMAKSQPSLWN